MTWSLVALVATAIVWKGSGLLETASERLSAYYNLPDIVQGAFVIACKRMWWQPAPLWRQLL